MINFLNLYLSSYGVQEMDAKAMEATNGGFKFNMLLVEDDTERVKGHRWRWITGSDFSR